MRRARVIAVAALAAAVLAVAGIVLAGDDRYRVQFRLENAAGLKDGSPVMIGGVKVGVVELSIDEEADEVVVELAIDGDHAPVGKDARASVVAQNLLGHKGVELRPGDTSDPAPDGHRFDPSRLTETTDLDQVLSALDGDTRARLAIFVNEAGAAFSGRRADFNRLLRDLAPALRDGTALLDELGDQNRTLARLVEASDRFVAELTDHRGDLTRMVERFADTATAVAERRADLRETLREAPGTLAELRTFMAELGKLTGPLQTTAKDLREAAGPLAATLDELEPFRRAAAPALRSAGDLAPDLRRLASQVTPVLEKAKPAVAELETTASEDLPPVGRIIDRSLYNILATVENWARAIQFRDGLGHVFRGEATVSLDLIVSAVERLKRLDGLLGPASRDRGDGRAEEPGRRPDEGGRAPADRESRGSSPASPGPDGSAPSSLPAPEPARTEGENGPAGLGAHVQRLLDFLLGG